MKLHEHPRFTFSKSDYHGNVTIWSEGEVIKRMGEDMGDYLSGEKIPKAIEWVKLIRTFESLGVLNGTFEDELSTEPGAIDYKLTVEYLGTSNSYSGKGKADFQYSKKELDELSPFNQLDRIFSEFSGW